MDQIVNNVNSAQLNWITLEFNKIINVHKFYPSHVINHCFEPQFFKIELFQVSIFFSGAGVANGYDKHVFGRDGKGLLLYV